MPGAYGEHGKCRANNGKEGKKRFRGKAFIPDDHIQLIAKNYQGANLNLEFELSDGEKSESYISGKKYRSESSKKKSKSHKSRRRRSSRRRKRKKQCGCCRCGKHSTYCKPTKKKCCRIQCTECSPAEKTRGCCCNLNPTRQKDFHVPNICCKSAIKNYSNSPRKVCCEKQKDRCIKKQEDLCCKKLVDPCCKKQINSSCDTTPQCCTCCITDPECVHHTCCGKADCGREKSLKRCPCCNAMVPECEPHTCCERKKHDHYSRSRSKKEVEKTKSTDQSEDIKTATSSDKARITPGSKKGRKDKRKGSTEMQSVHSEIKSKENKKQEVGKISSNSGTDKKVYVAKRVSDLESSEVYGKYWYHRPPSENVMAPCEEDYYEYLPPVYELNRTDRQPRTEYFREVKEPKRKNAGYCVGCKEPMCLICKNFICNCNCKRPNFVICTLCRHKVTPKKKKICPPPRPKYCVDNKSTDDGNDAMFLLPLLASMQGNANCQSCNC